MQIECNAWIPKCTQQQKFMNEQCEDGMSQENQLGINIRSLRKAYGETQEQLGEVLNVEKNTISS